MNATEAKEILERIRANIGKVIIGRSDAINLALICLICDGHALIEDVPGLGKTTLVSTLAKSIGCSFTRLQFTPDVMPSDVTGFTMYDMKTSEKHFIHGAVMTQVLLADEINRTSPKTQSALLQAMQEGQVTVDGKTHDLPRPFVVMATQNPVELTGTYALPEAQLDRFLMCITIGYPEKADEKEILERNKSKSRMAYVEPVADASMVLDLQKQVDDIVCTELITDYVVELSRKTRENKEVMLGVSPRGSIALLRAAMGEALMNGRSYVLPDDVQKMLEPVLAHRIVLSSQAYAQHKTARTILEDIKKQVIVPAVE